MLVDSDYIPIGRITCTQKEPPKSNLPLKILEDTTSVHILVKMGFEMTNEFH